MATRSRDVEAHPEAIDGVAAAAAAAAHSAEVELTFLAADNAAAPNDGEAVGPTRHSKRPAEAATAVAGEDVVDDDAVAAAAAAAAAEDVVRVYGHADMESFGGAPKRRKMDLVASPTAGDGDGEDPKIPGPAKRKNPNFPPPKKLNQEQWDIMFNKLVEYKEKYGDTLVPKRYTEVPQLGTWVETQRVQYKKVLKRSESMSQPEADEKGEDVMAVDEEEKIPGVHFQIIPSKRLNAERLERLNAIDFAWSARAGRGSRKSTSPAKPARKGAPAVKPPASRKRYHDSQWNEMYEKLVAYKEKYGNCLVPKKFMDDPKLGTWVETQRILFKREFGQNANEKRPSLKNSPEPEGGEVAPAKEDGEQTAEPMAVDGAEDAKGGDVQNAAADAGIVEDSMRRLTIERKEKLESLGFVWSLRAKKVGDHWEGMYQQLLEYKAQFGDCLVPSRYEENLKLGKWVECQRYEYTKLMRARGEAEKTTSSEADADAVVDANANANAGLDAPTDSGKKKRPPKIRLTEERLKRLEDVGFEWKVKNKMKRYYDKQWDLMYAELVKYKELNGDCIVPKRYPPCLKLGTWVHTQRIQYRKLMDGKAKREAAEGEDEEEGEEVYFRLTDDRRQRLEDIGFVWAVREQPLKRATSATKLTRNSYDDQWDAMFERLLKWKERTGDCMVPKRCKEDKKLGTWVDTQRVQYKRLQKKLAELASQEQGKPVPDANVDVDADAEGTGEASIPGLPPMPALPGVEAEEQPSEDPGSFASPNDKPIVGRLTQERINRLEEAGFVWALRDNWKQHYQQLAEYREEHGDCNVPARYAKNRRLGIWVSAQRQQYKIMNSSDYQGKPRRSAPLTPERIALLNALNFTWTIRSRDSLGESWNMRLQELKAYKAEHGNCLVPSRYPPNPELGVWVGTQRTQYRIYQRLKEEGAVALNPGQSSAMNEERLKQLEELGFVWALRANSDSTWKKRIAELETYRAEHGDPNVPSDYKANPRLGSWAAHQRTQYRLLQESKPSSLDEIKISELNSLGFNWDIQDEPAPPAMPVLQVPVLPQQPSVKAEVPSPASIQAPADVTAPEREVIVPAPAPIHAVPAPAPVHVDAAPAPIQVHAAPAPAHVHAPPAPVHAHPAPAPVHVHEAPAPVHVHAPPAPVHVHAAPAPVHVDASGQFPMGESTLDTEPAPLPGVEPIPVDHSIQPAGVTMAASMAAAGDLVAAAGAEQLAANIAEQMLQTAAADGGREHGAESPAPAETQNWV